MKSRFRILTVFGIFSSASAHAFELTLLSRNMQFHTEEEINYSAKCLRKSCLAKQAVSAYLKKPFPLKSSTGLKASAGSILCRDHWKEVSIVGAKPNRDQVALCLFSDQSIVDLDSLTRKLKASR